MMPSTQLALDWVFNLFNTTRLRDLRVEVGHVLWTDNSACKLFPGAWVLGPSGSQVRVYTIQTLLRIVDVLDGKSPWKFLGDYHLHPRGAISFAGHYPSPEDLCSCSALQDFWKLDRAEENATATSLDVAPSLQLIQSGLFGDVFAVEKPHGRVPFSSLSAQEAAMKIVFARYDRFLDEVHSRHDGVTTPLHHSHFIQQVQNELPKMNAALNGAAKITFHQNGGFASRCAEYLP